MISNYVKNIKDWAYLWTFIISSFAVLTGYYHDCQECFDLYLVEIVLGAMTVFTSLIVWFTVSSKVQKVDTKVDTGLHAIQTQLIKSEIDRLYVRFKDVDKLRDDEMKYLIHLNEQRIALGINSFTERKINTLLAKDFY